MSSMCVWISHCTFFFMLDIFRPSDFCWNLLYWFFPSLSHSHENMKCLCHFLSKSVALSPLVSTFSHTRCLKLDVSYEFKVFKGGHSLFAFRNPECVQYLVNFHPSCKFLILWRSTNGLNLPPNALTSSIFNHQEK